MSLMLQTFLQNLFTFIGLEEDRQIQVCALGHWRPFKHKCHTNTKALLHRLAGCPALRRVQVFQTSSIYGLLRLLCSLGSPKLQKRFRTLPQICASIQSSLGGLHELLELHGVVCALHSQLWDLIQTSVGGVQSTEFTTGRLQTSCRNIWQESGGNQMHLSPVLCVMIKAVNT